MNCSLNFFSSEIFFQLEIILLDFVSLNGLALSIQNKSMETTYVSGMYWSTDPYMTTEMVEYVVVDVETRIDSAQSQINSEEALFGFF